MLNTIEDQLILRAIKEECPWESLPKRLQSTLNSKDEWHRRYNYIYVFLVDSDDIQILQCNKKNIIKIFSLQLSGPSNWKTVLMAFIGFPDLCCFSKMMLFLCRITEHCIKKRLQWNTSFVRKVCREAEYYEDMMRYLRRNLAVNLTIHQHTFALKSIMSSPF